MKNLFTEGLQTKDELLFGRYAFLTERSRKKFQNLDKNVKLIITDGFEPNAFIVFTESGRYVADVDDVSELLNR